MTGQTARLWLARALIALVTFFNLQCAAAFLLWPARFTPGFELSGTAGSAAVQGMGLLFVMWNVPYLVALTHPVRRRISLYEAVAMQAIGFLGESLLLALLPDSHPALSATVLRFMAFDGAGLLALLAALALTMRRKESS